MPNHSSEAEPRPNVNQTAVEDWSALGDFLSLTTERLTAPVEGIHHAIAERWFGLAGSRAAAARRSYLAYTTGIYESVRIAGLALGTAVAWGAGAARRRNRLRPLWSSSGGSGLQAVANAVWGDELDRRRSGLRIEMGLRDSHGNSITLDSGILADAFPHPRTRLAVLLHGLGETERCWQGQSDEGLTGPGMADLLSADGFTPLLVRYNTGKHISDNGAELAALLERVVSVWPVVIEEISLIGNSMGGLVARSAVDAGRSGDHRWVDIAQHVVALGSPHLGSPLEKGANLLSWGLRLLPESRPLGEFIDGRSAGIKDLRYGAIREDDRAEGDPDALLTDTVGDAPEFEGVEQHFIAGVVTAEPTHPIGVLVGDLIVRVGSGIGRGRRRIEATDVRIVGRRRHFDLLHDPIVQKQVRDWLVVETGAPRG